MDLSNYPDEALIGAKSSCLASLDSESKQIDAYESFLA